MECLVNTQQAKRQVEKSVAYVASFVKKKVIEHVI